MAGTGGYFDDALSGTDGTGDPPARDRYPDALAQDTAPAQEWGGFALPRLPVAPGGDERAARALVEADELPAVRTPAPVPAGEWGRLQPGYPPHGPGGVPGWQAPSQGPGPQGWSTGPQGWSSGPQGWQAPAARGARPAPRASARPLGPAHPVLRPGRGPYVVAGVVVALLLLALVLLS